MAEAPPEDVLYDISPAAVLRGVTIIALFLLIPLISPNLEDVGSATLWVIGGGAMLFVTYGAVWAVRLLDSKSHAEALGRSGAWPLPLLLLVIYVFVAFAQDGGLLWLGSMAAAAISFAGWMDWPWQDLDAYLRRPPALSRDDKSADRLRIRSERLAKPTERRQAAIEKHDDEGAEDGASLVESGSFRVDISRMLEKLSKFQLLNAATFLLPWIRCAVAGGAGKIRIDRKGRTIEMRFDGDPIEPEILQDPYQALLGGEGRSVEPCRHLAVGMLAAMRLRPELITVTSGRGAARMRIRTGPASEEPEGAKDPGGDTVITIRWPGWRSRFHLGEYLSHARRGFGLCDAELLIDGKAIPSDPVPEGLEPVSVNRKGMRALLVPRFDDETGIHAHLYKHGAHVTDEEEHWWWAQCEAWISHDKLSLNLSHSGVNKDDAYEKWIESLKPACDDELPKIKKRLQKNPPRRKGKAYTVAALGGTLAATVGLWGGFSLTLGRWPDLALLLGGAYVATTAALLALCAKWFKSRVGQLLEDAPAPKKRPGTRKPRKGGSKGT